eukprot:UN12185
MCHERLGIVSPESGNQPLYSSDGTIVLIVNGEIYNYKEHRSELLSDGFKFGSKSDCEVIIPLFEKYGDKMMEKCTLLGMYGFVLYDEKTDHFIAVRDHVGIIPLYVGYGKDGSTWFASEMKALQEHCATLNT